MTILKHLLPLFFLILSAGLHAQDDPVTGTGVLLLTEPTLTFPPTPQDSTATISVTLINDVGADQTIDFTGLDAPFSASPNAFTIAANADTTVTFSFTPDSTGLFTADITATGNVFGEATLTLAGEGTLVQLVWLNWYNDAGIVPIGQTGFAGDSLYNMGTGTATLQLLGDSVQGPFTLLEYPTTIAGSNLGFNQAYFNVIFAPLDAGDTSAQFLFATNDPANPVLSLEVSGTGISEVSGEICDQTWTAANSPYTLVGDVVVPEGCTLNIDPGVVVIGPDHNIAVYGAIVRQRHPRNPITIEMANVLSHTHFSDLTFNHVNPLKQLTMILPTSATRPL